VPRLERHAGTVTYVKLGRNFAEHNAVMAGLWHARGDYAVIMDDDFQNPPEEVSRVVDHAIRHDYDIVYTHSRVRDHHWLRNLGSHLNDRVATFMLDKPRNLYLSSFKCLSRFLVEQILRYRGPYPYLDGLALRCTRNIGTIEVRHAPRREGRSNYTPRWGWRAAALPDLSREPRRRLGHPASHQHLRRARPDEAQPLRGGQLVRAARSR